jgi:hypothetical protein
MSDSERPPLSGLDDCGCCEGIGPTTPASVFNRPALSQVAYRTGTYQDFFDSMLARLTSADLPELAALGTRDEDDYSIALLDAWAVVSDVFTFYQERIANESFLRTALQNRSVLELARLIGHPPRPGVAAETYLAFLMEQAPGAPADVPATVTVAAGTKVQSVPGQDETAQTFETAESMEGRVAWNAMAVQTAKPYRPTAGATEAYLAGIATSLKPGDVVLFVGNDRVMSATSMKWDYRVLQSVETDEDNARTRIGWVLPLATSPNEAVETDARVYALRQRASLFGHNAPDPRMFPDIDGDLVDDSDASLWEDYGLQSGKIDLDAVYPKVVAGSWVVLDPNSGAASLYKVSLVTETTRTDYALSAKVTRITPDASAGNPNLPTTAVYVQSEELELAEEPLEAPLYGDEIELAGFVDGLRPDQLLAISGKRLKIRVRSADVPVVTGDTPVKDLVMVTDTGTVELDPDDEFDLTATPMLVFMPDVAEFPLNANDLVAALTDVFAMLFLLFLKIVLFPQLTIRWSVADRDGTEGEIESLFGMLLSEADDHDELVHEIVAIDDDDDAVTADRDRTTIRLAASTKYLYDRHTVTINGNVVRANHGESMTEILGSGDASATYQMFALKQRPLTYTSAATASGAASTLEVRVNDILWHEVPTLFGREPDERVFVTRLDVEGYTHIQFGDGITGARLPTGMNNVVASYRVGIGLDGLLDDGQLTMLLSRPLGLKEVTNPLPSEGAEDPESGDTTRENAPLTVLTLDRTVSLLDYEDFTRAYAGIAKAHAAWILDGDEYRVYITVAGPNGATIAKDSKGYGDLLDALAHVGDPHTRVRVESYHEATFRFGASVKVDPDYLEDAVLKDVEEALRDTFSFDKRSFGQSVVLSEVIATVQAVPGVIAVDVDALYRDPLEPLEPRLLASLPEVTTSGDVTPAELLILDPDPLDKLEVMA